MKAKGNDWLYSQGRPIYSSFFLLTGLYAVAVVIGAWRLGYFDPNGVPLQPNEWGDVLAGVFSPLAFLWLIYASLSQRAELAMQREELSQNNETQDAQREEMRRQVDAMTAQAKLLEAQAAAMFDPLFIIRQITSVRGSYAVTIENRGSDVVNIYLTGEFQVRYYNGGSSGLDEVAKHVYFWEAGAGAILYFDMEQNFDIEGCETLPSVMIQYTRKDGAMKRNVYHLSITKRSLRLVQSDSIMPSAGHK